MTVLGGVLLIGDNDHVALVDGNFLCKGCLVAAARPHSTSNGQAANAKMIDK